MYVFLHLIINKFMIYSNSDRYTYKRLWYIRYWKSALWVGKRYQEKINSTKTDDADYIFALSIVNLAFEGAYFIGAAILGSSWMIFILMSVD